MLGSNRQAGRQRMGKCIPSGRNSMCKGMVVFNNIIFSGAFVSCCCSVTKSCPTLCDPHGLRHAQLPCPSPSSRVCSDSCLLSQWCYLAILSSAVPFFSYPQSFPASGSFLVSQLFASGGQSIGASALGTFVGLSNSQGCCQLMVLSYGVSKAQSPSQFVLLWPDHPVGCLSTLEQLPQLWNSRSSQLASQPSLLFHRSLGSQLHLLEYICLVKSQPARSFSPKAILLLGKKKPLCTPPPQPSSNSLT